MTLNKFTHMPSLKNDAQLKKKKVKKKNDIQLNPRKKKKKKSKTPYSIDQTKNTREREKRNNRHMRKRGGFII